MIGALVAGSVLGYLAGGEGKADAVRLGDVFLLGPLMIYVAASADAEPAARAVLAAAGAATITYNGRNLGRL